MSIAHKFDASLCACAVCLCPRKAEPGKIPRNKNLKRNTEMQKKKRWHLERVRTPKSKNLLYC